MFLNENQETYMSLENYLNLLEYLSARADQDKLKIEKIGYI
jgi:hypothetical protein